MDTKDEKIDEQQNDNESESIDKNEDQNTSSKCDPHLTIGDVARISLLSSVVKDGTNYALHKTGLQQWRDRQNRFIKTGLVLTQDYGTYHLTKVADKLIQQKIGESLSNIPILNTKLGFWGETILHYGVGFVYEGIKSLLFQNSNNNGNPEIVQDVNDENIIQIEEKWFISESCVICLENINPNVTPLIGFLPCRHVCLCRTCYNRNRQTFDKRSFPCPLCRAVVSHMLAIN